MYYLYISYYPRSNLLFTCLHMRKLYKHLIYYINPKKFLHFFFLHLIYFAYDYFLRGIRQLNVTYGASEILIRQRTRLQNDLSIPCMYNKQNVSGLVKN